VHAEENQPLSKIKRMIKPQAHSLTPRPIQQKPKKGKKFEHTITNMKVNTRILKANG
jgi:hypothetical protein